MIVTLHTLFMASGALAKYLRDLLLNIKHNLFPDDNEFYFDYEDEFNCCLADYDKERGVCFFPSVCQQRYTTVINILTKGPWADKVEKVIDLGCHDTSFIKHLKDLQNIREIIGVDLELTLEKCKEGVGVEFELGLREYPLNVKMMKGNAGDVDWRLFGAEAVISIELIEHMLPVDRERMVDNIFGHIKPWVAVITTPNGEFNVLFKALMPNGLRRMDHFFEWTRPQFQEWANKVVQKYKDYKVKFRGIGPGPPGTEKVGCCTQMAVFYHKRYVKKEYKTDKLLRPKFRLEKDEVIGDQVEEYTPMSYELITQYTFPLEYFSVVDNRILEIVSKTFRAKANSHEGLNVAITIPLSKIFDAVAAFSRDRMHVRDLLEWNGYQIENGQVFFNTLQEQIDHDYFSEESWD